MRVGQLPQERFSPVSIPYGSWLRASEVIDPKVSQRLLSGMRPGGTNGSIASVVLLQRMQKRPISSGSFGM